VTRINQAASQDAGAELASLMAAAGINVTRNAAHRSDLTVVAVGPLGGVLDPALAAGRAPDAVGLHLVTPELAELVPSPLTRAAAIRSARALAGKLGLAQVQSADRPGLLVGGLLYPHLRDAVVMVADGYARPADVDAAMTLGCGYPRGPFGLLADAGLARVAEVLAAMHAAYGDPAYAPPPLLTEFARAGLALTSDE
jgi:3-hydroxybutyryl-CoA dehydrogenase